MRRDEIEHIKYQIDWEHFQAVHANTDRARERYSNRHAVLRELLHYLTEEQRIRKHHRKASKAS